MKKLLTIFAIAASTAAAEDTYVDFQTLTPELALTMAQQAMVSCEERGYQVGVTVVDRFGQPQAYLKNRYAGLHVYDTSRRKAWTAVSFRTSTSALAEQTKREAMHLPYAYWIAHSPLAGAWWFILVKEVSLRGSVFRAPLAQSWTKFAPKMASTQSGMTSRFNFYTAKA